MARLFVANHLPKHGLALLHTTAAASKVTAVSATANYDGEYSTPQLKTTIPGPKSKVKHVNH